MHLLTTSSTTLDEIVEAVDLGQTPGDIVVLSFADSDLAALASAWETDRADLPSVRLAHLRDLRHPMSVDLWIDRVGSHAKIILVRLLGGIEWWKYGVEQLSALARARGIALAVLPGEDRDDPRLTAASTLPQRDLDVLLRFFREGGRDNLRGLLRELARYAGGRGDATEPKPVPRFAGYLPGAGAVDLDRLASSVESGRAVVPILFYRALLLADDTATVDALCDALSSRGLAPAPLMVTSLKDNEASSFLAAAFARLDPAVIVTMTAFAAGGEVGGPTPLDVARVPVLQVVAATTRRAAWRESARGLGAADLAMHIVLPELDGRVLAGVVAFKDALPARNELCFTALASRPESDRVAVVADRIAALVRLQRKPRGERQVAVLMPDYPGAAGRSGYAVGLDVPASVLALLNDLAAAGYGVSVAPPTPRELLALLSLGAADAALSLKQYEALRAHLPSASVTRLHKAWGAPTSDPDFRDGAFHFRARKFGHVWVALPPDRGRSDERRADYHDPSLPPRHALVAFGLWLQHVVKADALVHMGAHGTLEWLPGKAVALTAECFPEIVTGALPVIYPFLVSNPGEAAQAKRRIAGITIGHLPPPLTHAGLSGDARELERLVDEYAQADGLDRRRRERLAQLIIEEAQRTGLAREAGADAATAPDDALRRIDAWLCDLKDLSIKDGLHIYGRAPAAMEDPQWQESAEAESAALLAALDGGRVAPGPAGSPARGRRDVLPTGRNLFTADPRTLPTPTAMDFGRVASEEIIRAHLQTHGEHLRSAVIDLWGSATLRTGGEEIAQGFALMGCRPIWDPASARVTGIEVLPPASIGRPRVDVTWRISGLFRDLFPTQIALIDAAIQAVAARDEADDENPLAAARRTAQRRGLTAFLATRRARMAPAPRICLAVTMATPQVSAPPISPRHRIAMAAPRAEVASRLALLRNGSRTRKFSSTRATTRPAICSKAPKMSPSSAVLPRRQRSLGRAADLVMLDLTDPQRPRARTLSAALARIVRARAINPRFIAGQMRHGPRGAAELAETVDRLSDFADTTDAVASNLFDLLFDAYVADPNVRAFLLRENPEAAASIAARLERARRRGHWHPRRNDVDAGLAALSAERAA